MRYGDVVVLLHAHSNREVCLLPDLVGPKRERRLRLRHEPSHESAKFRVVKPPASRAAGGGGARSPGALGLGGGPL